MRDFNAHSKYCNENSASAQGIAEGEARKVIGMTLAAAGRERQILQAQLRMLLAGLSNPERTFTATDAAGNMAGEYSDGGRWLGSAVRELSPWKISVVVGFTTSSRPSRHSGDVRVWRIVDEGKARLIIDRIRRQMAAFGPQQEEPTLFPASAIGGEQ